MYLEWIHTVVFIVCLSLYELRCMCFGILVFGHFLNGRIYVFVASIRMFPLSLLSSLPRYVACTHISSRSGTFALLWCWTYCWYSHKASEGQDLTLTSFQLPSVSEGRGGGGSHHIRCLQQQWSWLNFSFLFFPIFFGCVGSSSLHAGFL